MTNVLRAVAGVLMVGLMSPSREEQAGRLAKAWGAIGRAPMAASVRVRPRRALSARPPGEVSKRFAVQGNAASVGVHGPDCRPVVGGLRLLPTAGTVWARRAPSADVVARIVGREHAAIFLQVVIRGEQSRDRHPHPRADGRTRRRACPMTPAQCQERIAELEQNLATAHAIAADERRRSAALQKQVEILGQSVRHAYRLAVNGRAPRHQDDANPPRQGNDRIGVVSRAQRVVEIPCRHSGTAFTPVRPHQRFCWPSCRWAHFKVAQRPRRLPFENDDDLFGCRSNDQAGGGSSTNRVELVIFGRPELRFNLGEQDRSICRVQ